jgi:hypothetical protein
MSRLQIATIDALEDALSLLTLLSAVDFQGLDRRSVYGVQQLLDQAIRKIGQVISSVD